MRESFSRKQVQGKCTKYWIWDNVIEEHKPGEEHIGKRVYIAGYLKNEKFILKKIHISGEKYWPEDGYTVEDVSGIKRCFQKQEVRLHPVEYIKSKKKTKRVFKKKITVKDINKNLKEIKKLKRKIKRKKK